MMPGRRKDDYGETAPRKWVVTPMRTLYKLYASNPLQPFWRGILKCSGGLVSKFMRRTPPIWALLLSLAVLPTAGCVFRTRPVEDQYSKTPLKESSQQGLIDSINEQSKAIQSLKATVDIDSSAGGMKKGHVTDYKEIRGYILARKPDWLHMVGLMPIVRTTAFDMVSDGRDFRLWIPPKNKFVTRKDQVTALSTDQPMENLRPKNIYEALLIRRVDPDTEIAVL